MGQARKPITASRRQKEYAPSAFGIGQSLTIRHPSAHYRRQPRSMPSLLPCAATCPRISPARRCAAPRHTRPASRPPCPRRPRNPDYQQSPKSSTHQLHVGSGIQAVSPSTQKSRFRERRDTTGTTVAIDSSRGSAKPSCVEVWHKHGGLDRSSATCSSSGDSM